MACAFRCDLLGSVGRRVFVEGSPAAFPVCRATDGRIHPLIALEDFAGCRCAGVIDSGCDEGAAASHAFSVKLGVAFGYARPSERADKSACRTAHDRSRRRTGGHCDQPARSHDWSDTRNCQKAESRQKTAGTAYCGSDAGALPGVLSSVCRTILAVSVVDVVRNDAN